MQEFEQKILEQYDIEVSSTRKVRGAVLCETNKGLFLLKEIATSEKRIPALCELYTRLYEQGYHRIDYVVTNRNDTCFIRREYGERYEYTGREHELFDGAEMEGYPAYRTITPAGEGWKLCPDQCSRY